MGASQWRIYMWMFQQSSVNNTNYRSRFHQWIYRGHTSQTYKHCTCTFTKQYVNGHVCS